MFNTHVIILLPLIVLLLCQRVANTKNESKKNVTLVKDMKFQLYCGDLMPLIGIGTYLIRGDKKVTKVLDYALAAGYRRIDTAALYHNEGQIGRALRKLLPKYNLTRDDIFITTKLSPVDQGRWAYKAMEASLKRLGLEYVDLFLIHWPGTFGIIPNQLENKRKRDESWGHLVNGILYGLTKNIGVSNYNVRHLKELLANNHGFNPAVNQVEWHPAYHQQELLDLCNKEGILLEAYSSLGGTGNTCLLENIEVNRTAQKLGKTPAQVLLRWSIQQNVAVTPKATTKERIEENIQLDFTIPDEDMKALGNLGQVKFDWDPDIIV